MICSFKSGFLGFVFYVKIQIIHSFLLSFVSKQQINIYATNFHTFIFFFMQQEKDFFFLRWIMRKEKKETFQNLQSRRELWKSFDKVSQQRTAQFQQIQPEELCTNFSASSFFSWLISASKTVEQCTSPPCPFLFLFMCSCVQPFNSP